jgi:hypothetical protein
MERVYRHHHPSELDDLDDVSLMNEVELKWLAESCLSARETVPWRFPIGAMTDANSPKSPSAVICMGGEESLSIFSNGLVAGHKRKVSGS